MNIVENKHGKFDIDTIEGAEKYLESEGVNVAEYLQNGIEELKRHNKILNGDKADTSHESKVLNIPRIIKSVCDHPWQQWESVMGDGVLCRKCNTVIKQTGL